MKEYTASSYRGPRWGRWNCRTGQWRTGCKSELWTM